MTIEMTAIKRFRLAKKNGFVWIDKGEKYTVGTEAEAERHERGRGKRVKLKSQAPGISGKSKGQ